MLSECGVPVSPFPADQPTVAFVDEDESVIDDSPCTPTVKCGFNEVRHKDASGTSIPKLSLAAMPSEGQTYHEEFMSQAEEFSQSWREQLEDEESRFSRTKQDKTCIELDDDNLGILNDDQVSESGSVVHTVRHLKSKRAQQHRQRPHSSPTRRYMGADFQSRNKSEFSRRVGGGFTGTQSARASSENKAADSLIDSHIIAARKVAKQRVIAAQKAQSLKAARVHVSRKSTSSTR